MAGGFLFMPFRVRSADKLKQVFLRLNMRYTGKIIHLPAADLTGIFYAFIYLRQSPLQTQPIWSQLLFDAVPKQSKLPSAR